jgi:hypothetical protein
MSFIIGGALQWVRVHNLLNGRVRNCFSKETYSIFSYTVYVEMRNKVMCCDVYVGESSEHTVGEQKESYNGRFTPKCPCSYHNHKTTEAVKFSGFLQERKNYQQNAPAHENIIRWRFCSGCYADFVWEHTKNEASKLMSRRFFLVARSDDALHR